MVVSPAMVQSAESAMFCDAVQVVGSLLNVYPAYAATTPAELTVAQSAPLTVAHPPMMPLVSGGDVVTLTSELAPIPMSSVAPGDRVSEVKTARPELPAGAAVMTVPAPPAASSR